MNKAVQEIPLLYLSLSFIPALLTLAILYRWAHDYRRKFYALVRMPAQVLVLGYVLAYVFLADNAWIVVTALTAMVLASSWIALHTLKTSRRIVYPRAGCAIAVGSGFTLLFTTQAVLRLDPWYQPQYLIPLAGMIFSTAMNSISLAAERFETEIENGANYKTARNVALRISLIPITNSMSAVGLVLIPGIMTGQMLSGVSPHIAARYQIMVMCMSFASAGLSSACFLALLRSQTYSFAKSNRHRGEFS
ncbi:MAG TPA: ABC transporter permease [Gammaproteobacteria bacterium]|nr:ABC transporter permease [Gammaproteobacteria bacterium]